MENSKINGIKLHNAAVVIITFLCVGAIMESFSQGWEFWVPPLIFAGVIAVWWFHIIQYKESRFRENFYMIFSMTVAFFHGTHYTSYFDVVVMSALLMVTATLLKRRDYLKFILVEYFSIMLLQTIWAGFSATTALNSTTISRIVLHSLVEICLYKAFSIMLEHGKSIEDELLRREGEEEKERIGMEDFLSNISHELRTPVNVINGMSTLILKKEMREDVMSIAEAGLRLSHQIEDIQDYSEIQRGDVKLEEDRYMITSVLNDIATSYKMMNQWEDIEFTIDLDPNVPLVMKGDSAKITKIITHLLDNAFKFTKKGGVYLKISGIRKEYGINLNIEIADTGIGMSSRHIEKITNGNYRVNHKKNRSTGGIGLGLSIVYGFVRLMNGFVLIDSEKKKGTRVKISIVQNVLDPSPCLSLESDKVINVAFHSFPEKYKSAAVRGFHKNLGTNMALGLKLNLYDAPTMAELKRLLGKGNITHIFMGAEEYNSDPSYFELLAKGQKVSVIVNASKNFKLRSGSNVILLPKPLYSYPVIKILNGDTDIEGMAPVEEEGKPHLDGIRALIVDDEPMNLVVATGLFKEYNMVIDTAKSGKEALTKYDINDYDVVFMDHMMPEMDGVEAMKKIKLIAEQKGKKACVIALTANAMSGAREMFAREGFDGFISKPIVISKFERVMNRAIADGKIRSSGGAR